MTSTQSAESPGTVIGNHTKKYTAKNPAIRYLTERWVKRLDGMIEQTSHAAKPATNPLEVGAGEGVISEKLYKRFGSAVGLDLPGQHGCLAGRSRPDLPGTRDPEDHRRHEEGRLLTICRRPPQGQARRALTHGSCRVRA